VQGAGLLRTPQLQQPRGPYDHAPEKDGPSPPRLPAPRPPAHPSPRGAPVRNPDRRAPAQPKTSPRGVPPAGRGRGASEGERRPRSFGPRPVGPASVCLGDDPRPQCPLWGQPAAGATARRNPSAPPARLPPAQALCRPEISARELNTAGGSSTGQPPSPGEPELQE